MKQPPQQGVESVTISVRNKGDTMSTRTRANAATIPAPHPFSWKLWWKSKYEELSHSLFLAPSIAVVVAIIAAALLITFDKYVLTREDGESSNVPLILTTTVESARTVLGTVAGATISFAGIAFSVSLLVIQLGASQLSPRVIHTLFQDKFNKNVMALVVGTFTYCLVVLRSVRHALDETDVAVVPHISVAVAVVLGIISILATVAFIDHSAHSMDVSQILERVTRVTIAQIRQVWVDIPDTAATMDMTTVQVEIGQDGIMMSPSADVLLDTLLFMQDEEDPNNSTNGGSSSTCSHSSSNDQSNNNSDSYVVRFRRSGWVQEIDIQAMIMLVPPQGGKIQLHTIEGRYAIPGVAVCTITWSNASQILLENDDDGDGFPVWLQELEDDILNCIQIGISRTMRLDPSYGLRELVDVTLRALSPGVNDPTTAQDGIFHAAAVVIEFLKRNPPPHQYITPNRQGILILGEQQDHDGIVRLAYDEVRKCAASSPTVCVYLLESLRLIRDSLQAQGLQKRAPEIERQVRLIEAGCLLTTQVPEDHLFIAQARKDRFSDHALEQDGAASHRIPRKDDMNIDHHMTTAAYVPATTSNEEDKEAEVNDEHKSNGATRG